jgi:hypothetical protein
LRNGFPVAFDKEKRITFQWFGDVGTGDFTTQKGFGDFGSFTAVHEAEGNASVIMNARGDDRRMQSVSSDADFSLQ